MRLPVRSFKNFPLIVFVRRSAKRRSLTKATHCRLPLDRIARAQRQPNCAAVWLSVCSALLWRASLIISMGMLMGNAHVCCFRLSILKDCHTSLFDDD